MRPRLRIDRFDLGLGGVFGGRSGGTDTFGAASSPALAAAASSPALAAAASSAAFAAAASSAAFAAAASFLTALDCSSSYACTSCARSLSKRPFSMASNSAGVFVTTPSTASNSASLTANDQQRLTIFCFLRYSK